MTHPKRSVFAMLNDRATEGFYLTIACASLAFAGMLLGPVEYAERLLSLAWLFMLSAIAFLICKLGAELALETAETSLQRRAGVDRHSA